MPDKRNEKGYGDENGAFPAKSDADKCKKSASIFFIVFTVRTFAENQTFQHGYNIRWFQRDIDFRTSFFYLRLSCYLLATCDLLGSFLRLTCDFAATYLRLTCDLAARLPS